MKIFDKKIFWLFIIYFNSFNIELYSQDCGDSFNKIESGSKLECIQGIHSPINDSNPDYSTYIINEGFQFLTLILKGNKFDELILGYEGFYDFDEYEDNFGSYSVVDSFYVCDLKQNGPHYISFLEKYINSNGWTRSLTTQPEYFCDAGFIESSDRNLTIFEPVSFLPYHAYINLKEKAEKDNRDYIKEFNIIEKLKKAEVKVDKAYFHNDSNESTSRQAFVVKGDQVFIDKIVEGWIKVAYEGKKVTTEGWLKKSDLEILN